MLRFIRLRLSGFKSFVEPTDLLIEPGLTGIVGPNGCGKSNLVEAMRWVMGESSARQLRGGELEDVIFAGSVARPARDLAEVLVELDNELGTAPPPYHAEPMLQITRRIERTRGSSYRINGREVRARDVQLLFADAASGARSAAMVTQGQVAQLISAKPSERRAFLEEAAGVSGLHSRRQEAESKLNAAEANLQRVEDVLSTLKTQADNLKRQATQATRYRELSAKIRATETELLARRWQLVQAAREAARQQLTETEAEVTRLTGSAAACATRQTELAAALPDLRKVDGEAAERLRDLVVNREALDEEARRLEADTVDCRRRLAQAGVDLEREQALQRDAASSLQRLTADRERLIRAHDVTPEKETAAREGLTSLAARVHADENAISALVTEVAAVDAARSRLSRTVADLDGQEARLATRVREMSARAQTLDAEIAAGNTAASETGGTADTAAMAEQALNDAERARAEAEAKRDQTQKIRDEGAARLRDANAVARGARAERDALSRLLGPAGSKDDHSILDDMRIDPALEAAMTAALGEDMLALAQLDEGGWRIMPSFTDAANPPPGTTAFRDVVEAPASLDRRLALTFLTDGNVDGHARQAELGPGQTLVDRTGRVWRWDGFVAAADRPNPVVLRRAQRRRLAELEAALAAALEAERAAKEHAGSVEAEAHQAAEAERVARGRVKSAEQALRTAREQDAARALRTTRLETERTGLTDNLAALAQEREEVAAARLKNLEEMAQLPKPEPARADIEARRAALAKVREEQMRLQSALDMLVRDAQARQRRLDGLAGEIASWERRRDGADRQIADLDARKASIAADLARLEEEPARIITRRSTLLDAIEIAEAERRRTGDALAKGEADLREADRELRAAESGLATARENRVRAEAAVEQAEVAVKTLAERIVERLDMLPNELATFEAHATGESDSRTVDLEVMEKRLDRLKRERDVMGPVNLRADAELTELQQKSDDLETQRTDLVDAVSKLRQGLHQLDEESRERLRQAFASIDAHFRDLFTRLFGGGRAHLALDDDSDPLTAGLEVMASPPGKRLQSMSLLSGGEQTMAALALRFALFMVKPTPICVLDEVDAALDDANVGRFSELITDMATAGTRFLVITHHRLTMARMDRLFGVTMAEKGVSQMVSVDLGRAELLKETV